MSNSKLLFQALLLIFSASVLQADIINVPSQQPTIQAGIDAAVDDDTVLVADGTYTGEGNRDIDFLGKAIVVMSENGPESCVVDSEGSEADPHRGFHFYSGEDSSSVLQGFTIRNGWVDDYGAGIYCDDSSPTITGNIISGNGGPYDPYGGGICCRGGSATITGNTITRNSGFPGGGISCIGGSPIITGNTISGNGGYGYGGGIHCLGLNPTIEENEISGNVAVLGAGIYLGSGAPIIRKNTIFGNTCSWNVSLMAGGGIYCGPCSPTIIDNTICNNSSGGSEQSDGGGIYCSGASVTLSGNTIANNDGEGIFTVYNTSLTLSGNTIAGNLYYQLLMRDCSSCTINNSIIWDDPIAFSGCVPQITYSVVPGGWVGNGNIDEDPLFVDPDNGDFTLSPESPCIDTGDPGYPVPLGGACNIDMGAHEFFQGIDCHKFLWGAIYVPTDYLTIQEAIDASTDGDRIIVKPGTYSGNIDFTGKAITVMSQQGPDVTIISGGEHVVSFQNGEDSTSVLDGFTITNGGGIYCISASPSICNNIITGNGSAYDGGGIYCYNSSPLIINNYISENRAGSEYGGGGGIYCHGDYPKIIDNTVTGNSAGYGGGIVCSGYGSILIQNNIITENEAHGNNVRANGGGLYCVGYPCVIVNNTIAGNVSSGSYMQSEDGSGGGIYCVSHILVIEENTITGNETTTKYGGGIYCEADSSIILNNFIAENIAQSGGGIYSTDGSSSSLEGNVIISNIAGKVGGGAMFTNLSGTTTLSNNTISGNLSNLKGGGLYSGGALIIGNTILWGNDSWEGAEIWMLGGSSVTIGYSDVEGGQNSIEGDGTLNWLEGMIDEYPLFIDPENENYNLWISSPCIDTGDPDLPSRPWGGWWLDMGAYEYDQGFYFDGQQLIRKPFPFVFSGKN